MRIVRTLYPRHQRRIERFLARARASGVALEFCEGRDEKPDLELAFGGDGAVHYALERTLKADVPLLVVPFGSGNDFAESIGIHSEEQALRALQEFAAGGEATGEGPGKNVWAIDVGVVTPLSGDDRKPRYYCCVAGVGMDAQANITANAMPAWLRGHGGYIVAALKAIATFPPMKITIEGASLCGPEARTSMKPEARGSEMRATQANPCQPEAGTFTRSNPRQPEAGTYTKPNPFQPEVGTSTEDAWFAVFANAPRYGDGIFIAPKAKLDDGLLDVVLVGHMSRPRLLRFFPKVFGGSHLEIPEVRHGTAASVIVTTEPPLPIQGDGEYLCHTPARVEVRSKALKVIVPLT